MNYSNVFDHIKTNEQLKAEYFKLAKVHHPDVAGGDLETMQIINAAYDLAFYKVKDFHDSTKVEGEIYESTVRTSEMAADFIAIVNALIAMQGIRLELCGRWLYIHGDTKPHKDQLKKLGAFWAPKKECWYWRPNEERKGRRTGWDMDRIRTHYGSKAVVKDYAMIES